MFNSRITIKFMFAWYDIWVGAYWDRSNRRLYVLPLPCIGIVIQLSRPPDPPSASIWIEHPELTVIRGGQSE